MTTSYIAWDDGRLRPLLYGVMANIESWTFTRRGAHGHACTACGHAHACVCRRAKRETRRALKRCPWCTPSWEFRWAKPTPEAKPKKKRARRRATRRPLQPVP